MRSVKYKHGGNHHPAANYDLSLFDKKRYSTNIRKYKSGGESKNGEGYGGRELYDGPLKDLSVHHFFEFSKEDGTPKLEFRPEWVTYNSEGIPVPHPELQKWRSKHRGLSIDEIIKWYINTQLAVPPIAHSDYMDGSTWMGKNYGKIRTVAFDDNGLPVYDVDGNLTYEDFDEDKHNEYLQKALSGDPDYSWYPTSRSDAYALAKDMELPFFYYNGKPFHGMSEEEYTTAQKNAAKNSEPHSEQWMKYYNENPSDQFLQMQEETDNWSINKSYKITTLDPQTLFYIQSDPERMEKYKKYIDPDFDNYEDALEFLNTYGGNPYLTRISNAQLGKYPDNNENHYRKGYDSKTSVTLNIEGINQVKVNGKKIIVNEDEYYQEPIDYDSKEYDQYYNVDVSEGTWGKSYPDYDFDGNPAELNEYVFDSNMSTYMGELWDKYSAIYGVVKHDSKQVVTDALNGNLAINEAAVPFEEWVNMQDHSSYTPNYVRVNKDNYESFMENNAEVFNIQVVHGGYDQPTHRYGLGRESYLVDGEEIKNPYIQTSGGGGPTGLQSIISFENVVGTVTGTKLLGVLGKGIPTFFRNAASTTFRGFNTVKNLWVGPRSVIGKSGIGGKSWQFTKNLAETAYQPLKFGSDAYTKSWLNRKIMNPAIPGTYGLGNLNTAANSYFIYESGDAAIKDFSEGNVGMGLLNSGFTVLNAYAPYNRFKSNYNLIPDFSNATSMGLSKAPWQLNFKPGAAKLLSDGSRELPPFSLRNSIYNQFNLTEKYPKLFKPTYTQGMFVSDFDKALNKYVNKMDKSPMTGTLLKYKP